MHKIKDKLEKLSQADLKNRAQNSYREYEAIRVLTSLMTHETRKQIDYSKDQLKRNFPKKYLVGFIRAVETEVRRLRQEFGVKWPASKLIQLLTRIEDETKKDDETTVLLPKHSIKRVFSNYDRVVSNFEQFPEHICVGIELGNNRSSLKTVELYLLEAVLFEDMCALFNLSVDHQRKIKEHNISKMVLKTGDALSRATITAAIYFFEAYLNGLAADYYLKNIDKVDDKTKMFLTEWDYIKNRPKYIPLRDKALHYPRIILGTAHPPIQENNCPELKFIVKRAKIIRDAIVHASALPNQLELKKEQEIYRINFSEVEQVVDAAVILVRKMDEIVYNDAKRLVWLHSRNEEGFFPDEVFA